MDTITSVGAAAGDRAEEIGFLLLPGFALLSFASACEPFRAANQLAGRTLYRLRYFGEGSEDRVVSSSGAEVPTEGLRREHGRLHTLFVCAGGEPVTWDRPAIHAALRRLARFGVRIGGISGGPYLMAAAGLLADRAFTVHWEYAGATVEAFPGLRVTRARYVADPDRLTCGGGVAPLDMTHALIAGRMGEAFARRVSDWFLHTAIAAGADPQRASTAERYNIHHPALLAVIETMEEDGRDAAEPSCDGRASIDQRASSRPARSARMRAQLLCSISIDPFGSRSAPATPESSQDRRDRNRVRLFQYIPFFPQLSSLFWQLSHRGKDAIKCYQTL